jgi:hypothetical protein
MYHTFPFLANKCRKRKRRMQYQVIDRLRVLGQKKESIISPLFGYACPYIIHIQLHIHQYKFFFDSKKE